MTTAPTADYSEFEEALKEDLLQKLAAMGKRQIAAEKAVADAEDVLKSKKEDLRLISEDLLPALMAEARQKKLVTADDLEIEITKDYRASIPEACRAQAFAWLEKSGNGGMIKHEIKINFGRGEEAWAKKFLRDMAQRKKQLNYGRRDFVEPMTLKSFVKKAIEAGKVVPKDLLGVFVQDFAKVTVKK